MRSELCENFISVCACLAPKNLSCGAYSLIHALQVLSLMRLAPADDDDRLAKAALYTKYVELLPAALSAGAPHSLQLISDLLSGIKIVIAANPVPHQNLFR